MERGRNFSCPGSPRTASGVPILEKVTERDRNGNSWSWESCGAAGGATWAVPCVTSSCPTPLPPRSQGMGIPGFGTAGSLSSLPATQTTPGLHSSVLPLCPTPGHPALPPHGTGPSVTSARPGGAAATTRGDTRVLPLPPALAPMALLGLLVLLALARPGGATWDTCRGTCGLRPLAFDHSSLVRDYERSGGDSGASGSSGGAAAAKNGPGVPSGSWPGIVSIRATLENGTWHMCTGALIHPQWVLSVARCFIEVRDVSPWTVLIGATDLSQPGPEAKQLRVRRILMHQDYKADSEWNNIAVLELDQPVECSDYIQLACVPDGSLAVPELKTCYMAGWKAAPDSGAVLQEAKVRLMDAQLCNSSRWYGGGPCTPRTCARGTRGAASTPARGTSGGPLVCKDNDGDYFWLVGLASWGEGCAGDKRPGLFTSTQHFHGWIQVQMGLVPAGTKSPEPAPTVTVVGEPAETVPEPEPVLIPELEPVPVTGAEEEQQEEEIEEVEEDIEEAEEDIEEAEEDEEEAEEEMEEAEEDVEEAEEVEEEVEEEAEEEEEGETFITVSFPKNILLRFFGTLQEFLEFLRDKID
ncbi:acrosin-like [Oenanthe melanoleuca]|uniref:acrosin-like n=1 Tax=Oenanthe melanoleuca TaxID=2939378 RepID=UPI0024C1731F|nr:acrosin-like [Oenanthe melanoleuca]